jgi:hypothetical protein
MKQIARRLAQSGIATLRYDKRGVGAGSLDGLKSSDFAEYFAWNNFVGDALAAFRYLRRQPEIDKDRVGFAGHSEGGLIALECANRLGNGEERPLVLILLSTAGRALDKVIREQLVAAFGRAGYPADKTKSLIRRSDAITAMARDKGVVPAQIPPELAGIYPPYIGKFYQQIIARDPAKLAHSYQGPVLIVQGESDIQVSAVRDAPLLDAAFKARAHDDHLLYLAPHVSHNLKDVESLSDGGFSGDVDKGVADAIARWAAGKLGARDEPK